MSIIPPSRKDGFLIALAMALAIQIPSTIQAITDPLIRVCVQVSALTIVILLAWKAKPPKDPPAMAAPKSYEEPITLPDPPRERLNTLGIA